MAMSLLDLKEMIDESCEILTATGMALKNIEVDFDICYDSYDSIDVSPKVEVTEIYFDLLNSNVVRIKLS